MASPFVAGTALSAAQLNGALAIYKVRAYMNSGMTIGTSLTTLTGWTEGKDDFSGFDPTTGVFTCPTGYDGEYMAWATASWVSSAVRRMLTIYKGSTELSRSDVVSSTGRLSTVVLPIMFDLVAGDTVTVQALAGSSTTLDSSAGQSQFSLWKVG